VCNAVDDSAVAGIKNATCPGYWDSYRTASRFESDVMRKKILEVKNFNKLMDLKT
jgi:hypothetical protein